MVAVNVLVRVLSYGGAGILQTGPINGGLFLTDEAIEIGPGPNSFPINVRNAASFGITYQLRRKGVWLSLLGRHESGVPLEVEEDELDELRSRTGADLVDFARGRVKPWTIFDAAAGFEIVSRTASVYRNAIRRREYCQHKICL